MSDLREFLSEGVPPEPPVNQWAHNARRGHRRRRSAMSVLAVGAVVVVAAPIGVALWPMQEVQYGSAEMAPVSPDQQPEAAEAEPVEHSSHASDVPEGPSCSVVGSSPGSSWARRQASSASYCAEGSASNEVVLPSEVAEILASAHLSPAPSFTAPQDVPAIVLGDASGELSVVLVLPEGRYYFPGEAGLWTPEPDQQARLKELLVGG